MTRHQIETICWKEFVWRRSFKLEQVHEMLAHLATVSSRGAVIWEIRARDGFIRAEVIKYEDYIQYGSEAAVREAGKMGVEGKDYVVQDGDIMHFRFNV